MVAAVGWARRRTRVRVTGARRVMVRAAVPISAARCLGRVARLTAQAPGRCSLASRPGYCRDRPPARIPRSARSATPLLAERRMRTAAAAGHGGIMKPTQALHEAGQSLWLDN